MMTGTDHGSLRPATSRAFFGILTKVVVLAIMAVGLTAPYGYAGPPTEAMKTTIDEVLHIIHEKELKQPAKSEERRKQLEKTVGARFDYQEMSRRALGVPCDLNALPRGQVLINRRTGFGKFMLHCGDFIRQVEVLCV